MSTFKKIAGIIFATWALIVFSISLLLILLPIWLTGLWPEPKRTRLVFKIFPAWMSLFFILSGVKRLYKGRQHFKKGDNYIVVCNHRSFMDVPLTSPGIPGPNKTIAKAEMAKIPLFGIIYKRGSVLVDRKSEESRRTSFAKMKEVLAMGLHMCVYPEGTRNQTSEPLQRFHEGAFKLAQDTGKSIIPAVIFNTAMVLPRKGFFFWPHRVEMHFLPAVHVENKSAKELKEEVFEIMREYILRNQ